MQSTRNNPHHRDSTPWIVAHRGARDEAPENTRSAFVRALVYPIDGIELDVQLSADGNLIVYHDWTLRRVAGPNRYLFKLSVPELSLLDWGAWFDPAFAGEPLPLLERILNELGARTRWLVEIKSHPLEKASGRVLRLTDKVLELFAKALIRVPDERFYVLSFDPDLLTYAARRCPDVRYVLNVTERAADLIVNSDVRTDHLWAVDVPISKASPDLVQWVHRRGLRLFTYTCNGPRQVGKALALGVDGVITDRPGWLTRRWGRTPVEPAERNSP